MDARHVLCQCQGVDHTQDGVGRGHDHAEDLVQWQHTVHHRDLHCGSVSHEFDSFSQNKKRFEVLIKEEKMRYQYRQVFLVYYERENRYEILYQPTKRLGKYVSLPFQITDIKSGQEVVRYEETSKTIDYRINEIKKREPTAEYLFTEQNQ